PRSLPEKVTPTTNILWSVALGLPLALAVAHLYGISRNGRSWPKRWLGVQVLAVNGKLPGWRRSLLREGLGKWGGPIAVAYGVWQISGGFPTLAVLGGLGLLSILGESLTGLGNRPRRSWHDWIAGTCVVDQQTGAIIRLSSLWEEASPHTTANYDNSQALVWQAAYGGLTSVVLDPVGSEWNRHQRIQPSGLGLGLGVLLLLGGLAGVGCYHLYTTTVAADADAEKLYVNLLATLTHPEIDAASRQTAALALGNLTDDRVAPLLVDLLAQTENPQWLDTLQQALIAQGPDAIPPLRRLNQSLAADRSSQNSSARHHVLTMRLQTVNRILVRLVLLQASDHDPMLDLSRLHLGYLSSHQGQFTLSLKNQDLSGIQWQGTILNSAQLQGATFFSAGRDGHLDTYDDRIADLSGADLTNANLTNADLSLSRLVGSSLLNTVLNRANLTLADLTRANLENAQLIQANLSQAHLVEARLSNADLTAAQLLGANLENARLSEINAASAQMVGALMQGISAKSANLMDTDLSGAMLENADLAGGYLKGANLSNANLQNANLRNADLRDVTLQGANLNGVNFAGAILTEPSGAANQDFVRALPGFLAGNKLTGVDFTGAQNLEPEQLNFICTRGGIHPTCDLSRSE
ncbi:MAG: pentapeptide repeat-containing protein, partial [Cyanobacteria bacterium P01_F01_bin.86]